MTDDTGIATMNHAIMRVRYCGGKPGAEVERHAREEAGFGHAEQQPQHVEAVRADREARRRRHQAPRDHDPRQPDARADTIQRQVAGDLEQAVADEEHAGAEAELRRRQPDRLVHRQRGEADVVAIEVVEDVADDQDRHQPPADLGEDAAFRVRCGWTEAGVGHARRSAAAIRPAPTSRSVRAAAGTAAITTSRTSSS